MHTKKTISALHTASYLTGLPNASRATNPAGKARLLSFSGHQGNVPSLVFIHGVYHGSWAFETFKKPFLAAGWDVHLIDLRGHYGNQRIKPESNIGYQDYLSDVQLLLDQIPGPKVLIGHSLGGLLSLSVADRSDIQGIALLSTPLPRIIASQRWQLLRTHPWKSLRMVVGKDAAPFYHDRNWSRRYLFSVETDNAVFERAFSLIRQQDEPFRLFDDLINLQIPRVARTTPGIIIYGTNDPTVDYDAAAALTAHLPAPVYSIENSGHDLMLEPQAAAQTSRLLLAWLED